MSEKHESLNGLVALNEDYESLRELMVLLKQAQDKAHWLSVHRRYGALRHVEDLLQVSGHVTQDALSEAMRRTDG